MQNSKIGLAMTGGGARGAYQAGVLKRIGQIKSFKGFQVIGGASAGAVNAAALAAGAEDFEKCTLLLGSLWANIKTDDVYRSDLKSLIPLAGRWIRDLSFGGFYGGGNAQSLLDASPLRGYLTRHINFDRIQDNIQTGRLESVCVAATNYSSGKTYLFISRIPTEELWIKSRRIALDTAIRVEHICASAAIPVVFQPVQVTSQYGTDYFGDGCLRMASPLSPVIRLGADRILAIGVRSQKAADEKIEMGPSNKGDSKEMPPLAQVLGVTLNAIFLDHLDSDVEHLVRLNGILGQGNIAAVSRIKEPMKTVEPLSIKPSSDIALVAESFSKKMPGALRYLMAGLGTPKASSSDLISYLLFDSSYTKALVDMGYKDANDRIDEIEEFLIKPHRGGLLQSS